MAFPEEKKKGLELSAVVRAVVLLSLISAVFFMYHFTDYSQYITKDRISITIGTIRDLIGQSGALGAMVYIVAGLFAVSVNVPSYLIIAISVMIFGGFTGTLISAIIAYTGVSLVYFVAQVLGRPFVKAVFDRKLSKIEKRINQRGLMTVVYLRLIFFMAPALNWTLGVTRVSYKNFLIGTILGTAHNVILCAWFSGMVIDLIKAGEPLSPLKTPVLFLPLCIGIAIFFTIRMLDRHRRLKSVNTPRESV